MVTISDVVSCLEKIAPKGLAFSFDRIGLQLGDPAAAVSRAVVALDTSLSLADFAMERQAQLILTHHPLIWDPITVLTGDYRSKIICKLASAGIASIAAHTNWDCARGGVNDELARLLGLTQIREFGESNPQAMLKVVCFVPEEHRDLLVVKLTEAGAGKIGNYDRCAYWVEGQGTFRPLAGAQPTIGTVDEPEIVTEDRLEMVLPADLEPCITSVLRDHHPYEEPAFEFYRLQDWPGIPIGRIGEIGPTSLADFVASVDQALSTRCMAWGDPSRVIQKIAVVGGAADDHWRQAKAAGADCFVTGEVKHHVSVEASEQGVCVIAAGHEATEQPGCMALASTMRLAMPEVEWIDFRPEKGTAGRPI